MDMLTQTPELEVFASIKKSLTAKDKLIFAGSLLKRAYLHYPNNIALIQADRSIPYKELYLRSILLGNNLTQAGVKVRDNVILFYENSIEFYIAYFAIWQLGAVVVPLNIFLHPKELAHIIADSKPTAIISSQSLRPKLDSLIPEFLSSLPIILDDQAFEGTALTPHEEQDLLSSFKVTELEPDELCVLLYTSGTTGVPKGVMLSSKNIVTNIMQGYARFTLCGMKTQERFFCVLPLFHVFAQNSCLWLPIMIGATVIVVPKIDRKLITEGLEQRPTLFFGFPALYGLLCLMKTAPLDSIKLFISGADMLPDKIRAGFAAVYGRKICSGYGLSEASPIVAVNHLNNEQHTTVVGPPIAGIQCDIRSDDGVSLGVNTIGNLWIKGDNIMMGYYKAPDATACVLVDGWLNTGDMARKDELGNLAISGRSKDIIIHKGFNIYPAEIENVLMKHPSVFKAAVIGQDEEMSGQVAIAFLAVKKIDTDLEKNLRDLCAHNLAAYKIPRKFICLEDLPMNATGKVDKKKLFSTEKDLLA